MGDLSPKNSLKSKDKACRVFQGGNVGHLHSVLSIESSSQVLFTIDLYSNWVHRGMFHLSVTYSVYSILLGSLRW